MTHLASTPLELIERLNAKVNRGKKHAVELEEAQQVFFLEHEDMFAWNEDPKSKDRVYFLKYVPEIPIEFSLMAGDAIQNLRSSLDHLAYHLVCVGTCSDGPFHHVYFPIAANSKDYYKMRDRVCDGMRPEAISAIDAIQPYGGGAGEILWHIHSLNIFDKHRLLLTALARMHGHTMLQSQRNEILARYRGSYPNATDVPDLSRSLVEAKPKCFPLKAGAELLIVPESEKVGQMTFLVDIVFGEPKHVEGKSVSQLLQSATLLTRNTIFKFDRLGLL